jgi:hypothetical protein
LWFEASPEQIVLEDSILKIPNTHTQKGAGGVAQVVENLPSNREALSSNSSTAKNKQANNMRTGKDQWLPEVGVAARELGVG